MKLELDLYTKVILTLIAIGLILNAISPFVYRATSRPVYADDGVMRVKIVDFDSTWPPKLDVKITNWPRSLND